MLSRRHYLLRLGGIASLLIPFRLHAGSGNRSQTSVDIEQILQPDDQLFIERAFEMRDLAVKTGDQAYGALIVRNGRIIGQSPSHVVVHGDPTAHAEMEAIRDAARRTGSRDLSGSILYSSSPACPMCEAAAYWANIDNMIYGSQAIDGGRPSLC